MVIITANTANLSLEVDNLTKEIKKAITKEVNAFHDHLIRVTPEASGEMKSKWTKPSYDGKWTWSFRNEADHAIVIARGRRQLPNSNGTIRWYGSIQHGWAGGLRPFMKRFERILIGKIDNIHG